MPSRQVMGQCGALWLINGTPYDWNLTHEHSYQMIWWPFKDTKNIAPGQIVRFDIQWDQRLFTKESNDGGEAVYQLAGTPWSFQIQARNHDRFDLQIYFSGMSTQNNAQGSTISLGWAPNGDVFFVLIGKNGRFCSNNAPSAWMQANIDTLGPRPLRHLCIPGSHDSGMSRLTSKTSLGLPSNVLTQSYLIGDQLDFGIRYFDIRPVIAGGVYYTGHYGQLPEPLGWQGANGQSIADIINDINKFTNSNRELVILNLSHELNADDDSRNYRNFTQDEWNSLFQQLTGLNNLHVEPNSSQVNLADVPLNSFIGGNRAAVVVIVEPAGCNLGSFASRGFYKYAQYDASNRYSATDNLNSMIDDQITKMWEIRKSPNSQLFLLSWTLTQPANLSAVFGPSVLQLADHANPSLYYRILPACSPSCYPNILYIDNVYTSTIATLAMAINHVAAGDAPIYTAVSPFGMWLAMSVVGLRANGLEALEGTQAQMMAQVAQEASKAINLAVAQNALSPQHDTDSGRQAATLAAAAQVAPLLQVQNAAALSMIGAVALAGKR